MILPANMSRAEWRSAAVSKLVIPAVAGTVNPVAAALR
jgi:hypothetical protein